MDILIRLAGPVQTWVGYRPVHDQARTEPVPTISGVAGLLGACLGRRNYLPLMEQVAVRVRVDRTNAPEEDVQVASRPRPGYPTDLWYAADSLRAVADDVADGRKPKGYKAKQISITGSSSQSSYIAYSPDRSFIPSAEFLTHLQVDDDLGHELTARFYNPVFMPYLGRMANPATFPFYLGTWSRQEDPLAVIPHVPRHDERNVDLNATKQLRVHALTGDYTTPTSRISTVHAPRAADRETQLAWIKEHLTR